MVRWNFRSSDSCPHCGQALEDKAHITRCTQAEASLTWQQSLKQLEKWLQESNTAHKLLEAILWGLQQWRDPHRNIDPPEGQFFINQTAIRWERFLDGWLAKSW